MLNLRSPNSAEICEYKQIFVVNVCRSEAYVTGLAVDYCLKIHTFLLQKLFHQHQKQGHILRTETRRFGHHMSFRWYM